MFGHDINLEHVAITILGVRTYFVESSSPLHKVACSTQQFQ